MGPAFLSKQIRPGSRFRNCFQSLRWTAVQDLAAVLPSRGSDIDNPIRVTNYIQFVFHHKQGVAGCFEPVEGHQQCFGVRRMQSRRRLIQHIDDAEQIRTDLRGQA